MNFPLRWCELPMTIKRYNKQAVVRVIAGVLIISAALFATGWAGQMLGGARRSLADQEQQVLQVPETQARGAHLRSEVEKRQLDIQRIEAFLVDKDQLGEVVGEIESAGAARGLSVRVPAVEEKPRLDEQGNEAPPSGPLYEVRLKITATGSAGQLTQFLHDLEHMQRLAYFESWRLDAEKETARNQVNGPSALLLADFIVTVRREKE